MGPLRGGAFGIGAWLADELGTVLVAVLLVIAFLLVFVVYR
jgi:hypothetical protein